MMTTDQPRRPMIEARQVFNSLDADIDEAVETLRSEGFGPDDIEVIEDFAAEVTEYGLPLDPNYGDAIDPILYDLVFALVRGRIVHRLGN